VADLVRKERPMVLIAQLGLRHGDICGVIAELKKDPAVAHVPVIGFTSTKDKKLQDAAVKAGAKLVAADSAILDQLDGRRSELRSAIESELKAIAANAEAIKAKIVFGTAGGTYDIINNASKLLSFTAVGVTAFNGAPSGSGTLNKIDSAGISLTHQFSDRLTGRLGAGYTRTIIPVTISSSSTACAWPPGARARCWSSSPMRCRRAAAVGNATSAA
jgi:CheY-like chemotaxis protein